MIVKFDVTERQAELVQKCVERAMRAAKRAGFEYDALDATMDLKACHANGCKLDFKKLFDASHADFGHDVFGIRRHLDRTTGKLGGNFLPRCAKPERRKKK